MKNMKRIASFLLALALVFSLGITVFAADDEETDPTEPTATTAAAGTITITNAKKGETYNLYKIFDLTWDGSKAYSYTLPENSAFEAFFTGTGAGTTYFEFDSKTRTVTPTSALGSANSGSGVRKFADALMKYIAEANPKIIPDDTKKPDADDPITFTGLEYGYYMIDTTMGTVCVLDSNTTSLSVTDKTTDPTVDKQVKEDDAETGSEWEDDYATSAVGNTVYFRSIINNVYKRKNLVYHDVMSAGLTLNVDSIAVYMRPAKNESATYLNKGTDYTVKTTNLTAHGEGEGAVTCTFEIVFNDAYLSELTNTSYLVVEYSAVLNNEAVITTPTPGQNLAEGGNPNTGSVSYGDAQWSTEDKVTVHTWPLKVYKYTGTSTDKTPLAGAKFVLAKPIVSENKTTWAFVKAVNATNNTPLIGVEAGAGNERNPLGWVIVESVAADTVPAVPEGALEFESSADGTIVINGLDSTDEYYLIETEAPDGYNKLDEPIKFTINDSTSNGTIGYIQIAAKSGLVTQIEVENKTGSELPSTGGTGTTVLYILGSVLVLGAVVLLVTKKRVNAAG